jgi:hypothetical protein
MWLEMSYKLQEDLTEDMATDFIALENGGSYDTTVSYTTHEYSAYYTYNI